jgi:hypothetical protein
MTQPDGLCTLCAALRPNLERRPPNQPPVCDGCRTRVDTDLAELPAAYNALPDWLVPGRTGAQRAIGFESRPPLSIQPLSLIGPGSVVISTQGWFKPDDQIGLPPPVTLLHYWTLDWITTRGQRETPPPRTIDDLVRWLLHRLEWAYVNHPDIARFAADVNATARTVRAAAQANTTKGEPAGSCPHIIKDSRHQNPDRVCGAPLHVDPYVTKIKCERCGTVWDRLTGGWFTLRGQQAEQQPDQEAA